MLIQITNRCNFKCIHCMNNCTPDDDNQMTYDDFVRSVQLSRTLNSTVLIISGGEPTLHRKWVDIVSYACENMKTVIIATNGWWLVWNKHENVVQSEMLKLLAKYNNLNIQVTSIKGLYTSDSKHLSVEAVWAGASDFKNTLKSRGIKRRFTIATDRKEIYMTSLGRATEHEELLEEAKKATSKTTDCFRGCLAGAQTVLPIAISVLEQHGKFCTPRINCKGEMSWAECWSCPGFASINDPLEVIMLKARSWRPCGKCADYQKLLDIKTPDYVEAKKILGIE